MTRSYIRGMGGRKARKRLASRENTEKEQTLAEIERLSKMTEAQARAWVKRHRHDQP